MEMTNCYYYGQDCSECDDSEGIPECFKSRFENCTQCGRQFDIDVGCIHCELADDIDDEDLDDDDEPIIESDAKDGDGRYFEQIDRALI